ncbi:MAG: ATP-dependent helicase [Anaerovoracaceae bacterium]
MNIEQLKNDYNIRLNEQQEQAVKTVDGPVLLLAVPGSGKTTVIINRIAYMILCLGIDEDKILSLTFSKASARDMSSRFKETFGEELGGKVSFRTIHSFCLEVVNYYKHLNQGRGFEIITHGEKIINDIYIEILKYYPSPGEIKDIATGISYCKNMMMPRTQIMEHKIPSLRKPEAFIKIYERYQEYKKENKFMDYDDMLIYTYNILRKIPKVSEHFKNKYDYVNVDEAQDTSKVQHKLIDLLCEDKNNIFMVGDEDQSIYGFRAAYPEMLLNFHKRYEGAKVLKIETNYRSTDEIISCAQKLIENNENRIKKTMEGVAELGVKPSFTKTLSYETYFTSYFNNKQNQNETDAIIYRNSESAVIIADALDRNNMDFNIYGRGDAFFDSFVLKDILDILTFLYNPQDKETFKEIYYKLKLFMNKQDMIRFVTEEHKDGDNIFDGLAEFYKNDVKKTRNLKLYMIRVNAVMEGTLEEVIMGVMNKLGYKDFLKRRANSDLALMNSFVTKAMVLASLAKACKDLDELKYRLEELAGFFGGNKNSKKTNLVLTTMHSSKGLEFDNVFVIDMMDRIMPGAELQKENKQMKLGTSRIKKEEKEEITKLIEEERRLFYVAITRGKKSVKVVNCPMAADSNSMFLEEVGLVKKQSNKGIRHRGSYSKLGEEKGANETGNSGTLTKLTPEPVQVTESAYAKKRRLAAESGNLEEIIKHVAIGDTIVHSEKGNCVVARKIGDVYRCRTASGTTVEITKEEIERVIFK